MKTNGKKYVALIGSIVSGRSGNDHYYGRYAGSDTVLHDIGTEGDIEVYVNSPGGSVFAGFEIMNALSAASTAGRSVTIYISAMAASIASYITSGVKGAKIYMADNAKLMFHAPWTGVMGSKTQLQDTAELLGKMEEDIAKAVELRGAKTDPVWFAAGRMKWYSAKEAVAAKLADAIADPPQELIAAVSKDSGDSGYSGGDEWDKTENKRNPAKMNDCDLFAASSSFAGYLQALVQDRFGEGTNATIQDAGVILITKENGDSALLKYTTDSLNIATVDWDSAKFEAKQESVMKTEAEMKVEVDAKVKAEADAKAKADADVKAKADETAKAEADAKIKAETDAKAKADADAKAKADEAAKAETKIIPLPAGMTEDMIVFAKVNYQAARNEYISMIKAAKTCEFTDEELAKFDIATLAKMAKLPFKLSEKDTALKADNSLIAPDHKAKGTGGSLPPPEM